MDNYRKFIQSYETQKLLEKYPLDTEGYWVILSGHNNAAYVATVSGKLHTVIYYAVALERFYGEWGNFGVIQKIEIVDIQSNIEIERELKIQQQITQLEYELKEAENKVHEINFAIQMAKNQL